MQKRSLKQKCLAWLLSLAVAVTFIPLTAGFAFADDAIEITADDVVIPAGDLESGAYSWTGNPIYPMPVVTVNDETLTCKSTKKQDNDPEVLDENGQFTVEYPDTVENQYAKNGEWTVIVKGVEPEYTGTVTKTFFIDWGTIQEFSVTETNGKNPAALKSAVCPIEDWEGYAQHGKITSAWRGGAKKVSTSSYIPLNTIISAYDITFGEGDIFLFDSADNNPAMLTYDHLTTNVYGLNDEGETVDIRDSFTAPDGATKLAFVLALDDRPGNNPRAIAGNDQTLNTLSGMQAALSGIISLQIIHPADIADVQISGLKTMYAFEGEEVEPEFTLTDGDYELVKGTDYEVTFEDNAAVGTAKVTITGKGAYKNSREETFMIVSEDVATAYDTLNDEYNTLNDQYDELSETYNDVVEQLQETTDALAQTAAQVQLLLYPVKASVSNVTTTSAKITLSTAAEKDGFAVNGKTQTSSTYYAKGLKNGSSNTFKVYAYKTVAGKKVTGQTISVKVNTKPAKVSKAPTVAGATKAITVKSWAKASGAAKYQISVSKSSTGTSVKATKSTISKTTIKNLEAKKYYYVKVRAVSKAGVKGAWSPVKKIKTK